MSAFLKFRPQNPNLSNVSFSDEKRTSGLKHFKSINLIFVQLSPCKVYVHSVGIYIGGRYIPRYTVHRFGGFCVDYFLCPFFG
jgi:hypothetical protein